jgi:hypothetical protein
MPLLRSTKRRIEGEAEHRFEQQFFPSLGKELFLEITSSSQEKSYGSQKSKNTH